MMNTVIVRKPKESDHEKFVELSLELSKFNRSHHPQKDDFQSVLKARTIQANENFDLESTKQLLLLAEVNGEVVGYVLANVHIPDASFDNGTELTGLLDEIFILEKARGLKLGKRLMDEAIEWMKNMGAKRVKLHMYAWNTDHAGRFYEKEGFHTYAVSMMKELE